MCCDAREEEVVREISLLLNLGREEANIADGGFAANKETGSSCFRESRSSAIMALILLGIVDASESEISVRVRVYRRWSMMRDEDDDSLILFGG